MRLSYRARRVMLAFFAAKMGLVFNGVQAIPGLPDQWVFTDRLTHGTFHTPAHISLKHLQREAERIRARFGVSR